MKTGTKNDVRLGGGKEKESCLPVSTFEATFY